MMKTTMEWTDPKTGRPVSFEFGWRLIGGRYECFDLRVTLVDLPREKPQRVVTAGFVGSLPIAAIINQARREAAGTTKVEAVAERLWRPKPRTDGRPTKYGDDHWKAVAAVYRAAYLDGRHPTKAVREAFGIPAGTAGDWVTRCRNRGFLPKHVENGKAGLGEAK